LAVIVLPCVFKGMLLAIKQT